MNKICVGASLLVASVCCAASDLQQISKRLQITSGLQVKFTQKVMTIRKKIRTTEGDAYFHPDGKFRWLVRYQQEAVQEFIYDGKSIVEHLPAERIANIWGLASSRSLEINRVVTLIKSLANLQRDYRIKEQRQTAATLDLLLIPQTKSNISQIQLTVSLTKNFISRVKIIYQGTRYSELIFTKPLRQKLAPQHFTFTAPKGTRVMLFK